MKEAPVIIVQLVHLQGPKKGEIQQFSESPILVGRHPSSHVAFPPDLGIVSRKHAEIVRDGNRFKLIDLSTNGTYVNGKRVKEEAYLKNGDVVMFSEGGPKVSFLIEIKEGVEPEKPSRVIERVEPAHEPAVPRVEPPRAPEPKSPPVAAEPKRADPVYVEPAGVPLVIQYGPTLRAFKQVPVTIGRHPNCHFAIDHPSILDMHAQVFYSEGRYWVKDLTGRRLVVINGEPVGTQCMLRLDDLLGLSPDGPFFRFLGEGRLAQIEETPLEPPAPPEPERAQPERDEKTDPARKSILRRFFDK